MVLVRLDSEVDGWLDVLAERGIVWADTRPDAVKGTPPRCVGVIWKTCEVMGDRRVVMPGGDVITALDMDDVVVLLLTGGQSPVVEGTGCGVDDEGNGETTDGDMAMDGTDDCRVTGVEETGNDGELVRLIELPVEDELIGQAESG